MLREYHTLRIKRSGQEQQRKEGKERGKKDEITFFIFI
jgi:hypothetical protein